MTVQPAFGHLHPVVPLARALAAAGHDVVLASSASFSSQLAATGLRWLSAGIDWLESEPQAAFPDITQYRGLAGKQFILGEIFSGRTAAPMAWDLLASAEGWRPDLVIREPWEFGGALLAAKLGIPCVVHGVGRWLNAVEVRDAGSVHLQSAAATFGIDRSAALDWVDGDLYLDPCPPALDVPTVRPKPPHCLVVRPVPWDTSHHAQDRVSWPRPGGRRLIYVGLGTVMNRRPGVLDAIVADVQRLDADVVVTTGPGIDPAELGALPANVYAYSYVPLSTLLPHCDVVVCHAGWGTAVAALAHSRPLICVPLGSDGYDTAAQVAECGAGLVVDSIGLATGAIGTATQALLDEPCYQSAAECVGRQIASMPEPASIIEDLVALTG